MSQRANSGHWKRSQGAFRAVTAVAVAFLALLSGPPAAVGETSPEPGLSVEALVARGIVHSGGADMRLGLEELRAAVELAPGHALARHSLALALLRAGLFDEAEDAFSGAVGRRRSDALASGELSASDLGDAVAPDALLGLATAVQFQGRTREADRLLRAYAELVGPMTKDAGRAYLRLHELAVESGAAWLDADAELAKALAVDPDVGTAGLLPSFADPAADPALEPYLRPIALAPARADSALDLESLPALALWVAPPDTSEALEALGAGRLRVEMLIDEHGVPAEIVTPSVIDESESADLVSAASAWRFTPAKAAGESVPAWIVFGSAGEKARADSGASGSRDTGRAEHDGGAAPPEQDRDPARTEDDRSPAQ
jgi:tetratricopeptide (TPR) repeat protein